MVRELYDRMQEIRRVIGQDLSPERAYLLDSIVVTFYEAIEHLASDQHQTGTALNGIRGEVETAAVTLREGVTARLEELAGKFDNQLKESADHTRRQFESAKRSLDELRQGTASLRDLIERTQDDVDMLERRLRLIQAPGMKADIDAWALGQTELGARVLEGRKAARRLHDTNEQALHARIAEHERKVAAHQHHRHRAVEAARLMTTLDPTSRSAWPEPMRTWTENHAAAVKLTGELPASEADARDARAQLELIARWSSELRPAVERGEEAAVELRQNVMDYMKAVVDADQLFPMWFVQALGMAIPRKNWEAWLQAAIGVICYRIVYGVPDRLYALGAMPKDEEQRAEYDRLTRECASWRR